MKKISSYLLVLALGIGIGTSINLVGAAEDSPKPAYLIVSSAPDPAADYGPYSEAAGPLAQAAGLQFLAPAQPPVVLEGAWPFSNITLETFPSMQALTDFWYSDAYQQAKQLREGLGTIDFIVAVEGI